MADIDIKQAVILAGGRGERLRPLTDKIPKPMVPVCGRPFLKYLIELLKENGITKVLLLLGYLPEKVVEYFGDGSKFGLKIEYSITDVSDETGMRLRKAKKFLENNFLLMYCDNYWPLDLKKIKDFYNKQKTLASVTVFTNKEGITKNNIFVDEAGYVIKYDKSRQDPNLNGVEIGFFVLNKKILELFPDSNFNFEKEILPILISQKQLSGFLTKHRYYSVGTPEKLAIAEKFFQPKKNVFLDRDGIINKKPPKADYVKKWKEFEFLPGAIEGLKVLVENNYDIYIISNQAGIARGAMTKENLDEIQEKMEEELQKNGIKIKGYYYCLHGWNEGCDCRKPKPGLLFLAANENFLDLSKVIFIGDDERDLEAGEAAGTINIFLNQGENLLDIVNKKVIDK